MAPQNEAFPGSLLLSILLGALFFVCQDQLLPGWPGFHVSMPGLLV